MFFNPEIKTCEKLVYRVLLTFPPYLFWLRQDDTRAHMSTSCIFHFTSSKCTPPVMSLVPSTQIKYRLQIHVHMNYVCALATVHLVWRKIVFIDCNKNMFRWHRYLFIDKKSCSLKEIIFDWLINFVHWLVNFVHWMVHFVHWIKKCWLQ